MAAAWARWKWTKRADSARGKGPGDSGQWAATKSIIASVWSASATAGKLPQRQAANPPLVELEKLAVDLESLLVGEHQRRALGGGLLRSHSR